MVFRNVTVSKEVSSGLKDYPSGAGRGDVFLLPGCLLIIEDENVYSFPALTLTMLATDWQNTPNLFAEKVALESVEFKESANGVRIVQMVGYDTKYKHRKYSVAIYNLTAEAFRSLKVIKEWVLK
ncbi:MAG: hypothetical protein WDO14_21440 [Bacteroidota bacterium]